MFVVYLSQWFNKTAPKKEELPKERELDEFGDPIEDVDLTPEQRDIVDKFNEAVNGMRAVAGVLQEDILLRFYALFKQGTVGSAASHPRPSMFDIKQRTKYDAWNALGEMDEYEAMQKYAELMATVIPDAPGSDSKKSSQGFGLRPSTMQMIEDENAPDPSEDPNAAWFSAASSGDVEEMAKQLSQARDLLDTKDTAMAMSALLWATDAGQKEAVEWLLEQGADVSATDNEGNTALHLAAICDYKELSDVLRQHGADEDLPNHDGQTAKDLM